MDCIYNQMPLKALYNIASHSPIHAHIRKQTAVSLTQGVSHLVGSSEGEASSLRDSSTLTLGGGAGGDWTSNLPVTTATPLSALLSRERR